MFVSSEKQFVAFVIAAVAAITMILV